MYKFDNGKINKIEKTTSDDDKYIDFYYET